MRHTHDLLVFSHLRWDFVYQRPQHLISRLARRRRILFLEEPVLEPQQPQGWQRREIAPKLEVYRYNSHEAAPPGFSDPHLERLGAAVPELMELARIGPHDLWFYTPMAWPLAKAFRPRRIVYDCMDELSAFLFAPPELLERERQLLAGADLVFTGGPSLYRAKKPLHPRVHCFPSSVDAAHFRQANCGLIEPPEQAALPHPRLGFFGVIDERLDIGLLDALARAHPQWQIVLVGPVVKIDPATLPRHPNLHYFGQRPYSQLPQFLAGWDVCLLPFARNASTQFISPTKTLEYMAAAKPIVSTPITDVAQPYGHIVYLGDTPEAFGQACAQALHADMTERTARTSEMARILSQTSWDHTARAMEVLLDSDPSHSPDPDAPGAPDGAAPYRIPVAVIGAGPTGLSAAYHLGEQALLLDQNPRVGGWCRSLEENGFTFDCAGHIMFSQDPYVHELYQKLLGANVHWQNREAWIYSKNVYTRYPFQGALYGLPPQVIKECLVGALEARFGPLKAPAKSAAGPRNPVSGANGKSAVPRPAALRTGALSQANAAGSSAPGAASGAAAANNTSHNGHGRHVSNGASSSASCPPVKNAADEWVSDCCADGRLEATAPLTRNGNNGNNGNNHGGTSEPQNFEDFIFRVWGAGIAKHFAIPYNRKLWAVPLTEMETSWLGGRVPLPDIEEIIDGALQPVAKPMGPNARFGYPLRGGFQALMDGFLPLLKGPLWLQSRVVAIDPIRKVLSLQDGRQVNYEQLISTMPLPVLVKMLGETAPEEIRQAAAGLRHVSVRCVNLGIGREHLTDKHWIYYPEESVFHRIFVQGNASPHCNAPGGFGLTCEITYSPQKPLPCDGQELIDRCIADCHRVGIFQPSDPVWLANQVDMPYAYVVYDHARPRHVAILRRWLKSHQIILAGRYSEWEYYNSDHAFLAGKKAADEVRERQRDATGSFSASLT